MIQFRMCRSPPPFDSVGVSLHTQLTDKDLSLFCLSARGMDIFTHHTEIYNFIHRTPTIRKREREREFICNSCRVGRRFRKLCVRVMPAKFVCPPPHPCLYRFKFSRYRSFSPPSPPPLSIQHPSGQIQQDTNFLYVTWKTLLHVPTFERNRKNVSWWNFVLTVLTDYFLFQYQCHFVSCDDSTCSRWVGVVKHDIHQMRRDSSFSLGRSYLFFIFPISFRRYMSWRGQFGFLVVASGMGRWFSFKS